MKLAKGISRLAGSTTVMMELFTHAVLVGKARKNKLKSDRPMFSELFFRAFHFVRRA